MNAIYIAQAAADQQGDPMSMLITFGLIGIIFYFLLIRPQQKRNKEHKAMIESLGKGSYVMTSAGFLGRIVDIEGDILVIDLGETKVRMPRGFVSGTYDPKNLSKPAEAADKKKSHHTSATSLHASSQEAWGFVIV